MSAGTAPAGVGTHGFIPGIKPFMATDFGAWGLAVVGVLVSIFSSEFIRQLDLGFFPHRPDLTLITRQVA